MTEPIKTPLRGQTVTYDARANGIQTGKVLGVERIKSHYGNSNGITYVNIEGAGLLVPLDDILEVHE